MTEISIREKEKWLKEWTDKQEMADSFLHNITYHTQCLYQISSSYVKQFLRNFRQKFPYSLYRSDRWKNSGIYLEFLLDGPLAHPTKIPWALTLAGGLGAARLTVGSRGNALVRGPGSSAEIRFKHFACA